MNSDELSLWRRCRRGEEKARDELIILYRPLAKIWARRISMIAGWANSEDLEQEGVIGLMNAIERFDPNQGVKFKFFARRFIRGAILDSSEFTRDLARRQREIYREMRLAENELTNALGRFPTIEEVAEKTGLTTQQIRDAIHAVGVAGAGEMPDHEITARGRIETPHLERTIMLLDALALLSEREQRIIDLFYWQDQSPQDIAQKLGLTASNVTKIRQRAIKRLGKLLDVDGGKRSG